MFNRPVKPVGASLNFVSEMGVMCGDGPGVSIDGGGGGACFSSIAVGSRCLTGSSLSDVGGVWALSRADGLFSLKLIVEQRLEGARVGESRLEASDLGDDRPDLSIEDWIL